MLHFNAYIMLNSNHFASLALVGLAAVLASCSVKEDHIYRKSNVSVNLQTFNISQSPMTKATAEEPPHRIVFKAIASDNSTAYETVQRSDQTGYGTLNFELAPGEYDFVAVAHDVAKSSDTTSLVSITSASLASFPDTLVQETFCAVKHITISPSTSFSTSMTLPRVVSCFRLIMNGTFPTEAKTIKLVANPSVTHTTDLPTFDPSTGLASTGRQWIKTADSSKSAGKQDLGIKIYLFLTAVEQNIDIVATAYDAQGAEIVSHTFSDIPMKQNRMTVASGDFFNGSGSGSFTFNTDWEADSEISY